MSKHKKTRNQKIIADLKRKLNSENNSRDISAKEKPQATEQKSNYSLDDFSKSAKQISQSNREIKNESLTNMSYLYHDLKKTGILTATVVGVEILLFLLIKNNLISVPILNY